jgi:crossover junction endodeoxyribonuclease RusA
LIYLPYPPTINHYYYGGRVLNAKARQYRQDVQAAILASMGGTVQATGNHNLSVEITLMAPDRRKRDIDNPVKPILDGLQYAGVIVDDSQVNRLTVVRGEPRPPSGLVGIKISNMERAP